MGFSDFCKQVYSFFLGIDYASEMLSDISCFWMNNTFSFNTNTIFLLSSFQLCQFLIKSHNLDKILLTFVVLCRIDKCCKFYFCFKNFSKESSNFFSRSVCDTLRDLEPFVQFKKRQKTVLLLVNLQAFTFFLVFLTFFNPSRPNPGRGEKIK